MKTIARPSLYKVKYEIVDTGHEAEMLVIVLTTLEEAWGFDDAAIQARKILDEIHQKGSGAMITGIESVYWAVYNYDGERLH